MILQIIISREDWLWKPANSKVENYGAYSLWWKLPDRAQSFAFCLQIVTE